MATLITDTTVIVASETDTTGAVAEDSAFETATGEILYNDLLPLINNPAITVTLISGPANLGVFAAFDSSEVLSFATGLGRKITWTYTLDDAASQSLAAGQNVPLVYRVSIDDGDGNAANNAAVDITITAIGSADATLVVAGPVYGVRTVGFTATDADSAALTFSSPNFPGANPITSGQPVVFSVAAGAAVAEGPITVSDGVDPATPIGFMSVGANTSSALTLASVGGAYGFEGDDTITGSTGNDVIYGRVGDDVVTGYDLSTGGADQIDLGLGFDRVDVSAGSATQIRVTFVSTEVGNGSALNATAPGAGQAYSGEPAGGLAVRLQAEDALGALTGNVARTDDEGITFVAAPGTTFDVRDLVAGTQRGDQFNRVVLGTSSPDLVDFSANSVSYYVNSGAGNDTLIGGTVNDFLVGNGGSDTLIGKAGNDGLLGGGGNDVLNGGLGADLLNGGADADRFVFNAGDSSSTTAFDSVADFVRGTDKLAIAAGFQYAGNVVVANEADLIAAVNAANGANFGLPGILLSFTTPTDTYFFYDANGDDTANLGAGDLFVKLTGVTVPVDASDFVAINGGNDNLVGTSDADNLDGGAGNDVLTGAGGADVLTGGTGANKFVFNQGDSSSTAAFDNVTDFVRGTDLLLVDAGFLYGGNIGFANEADLIAAANGSNGLNIGVSDIIFSFTTPTDTYFYYDASGDGIVNLGNGDLFVKLTGVAGPVDATDFAAINGGDDNLVGTSGVDVLDGSLGNDTLNGTQGADLLTGGAGTDTFVFNRADSSSTLAFDTVTDFVRGTDKLAVAAGFVSIGNLAFASEADLLAALVAADGGGVGLPNAVVSFTTPTDTYFYYDVNGNGFADLSEGDLFVKLTGVAGPVDASDFVAI